MNKILVNNNILEKTIDSNIDIKKNNIFVKENCNIELEINIINSNYNFNIIIGDNSNIIITLLIQNSSGEILYTLSNNSILNVYKFNNNKVDTYELTNIDLIGYKSILNYNYVIIAENTISSILNVNHLNNNTVSNVKNHGITVNHGSIVFDINTKVLDNINNSKLDQVSKIIPFNNKLNKINPNMFIGSNECNCKHGATIGSFNDEVIFYLMSRGLTMENSIKLLIYGFVFEILHTNRDYKNKINNILNKYWR